MKRCLLLVVVVALLVPPPIHAHESSIKKATIIGALAGIGTSILIVGIEPKEKDPWLSTKGVVVDYKDKYNAAQIGMIGLGTGILVGTLSYFYFDGKSKNYSIPRSADARVKPRPRPSCRVRWLLNTRGQIDRLWSAT